MGHHQGVTVELPEGTTSERQDAEAPREKSAITLKDLPPLLPRGRDFYMEPICGGSIVAILSAVFMVGISFTTNGPEPSETHSILFGAMCGQVGLALFSLLFLWFGEAGVVKRSTKTCFPIPAQVEERLQNGTHMAGMENIQGPEDDLARGSYCVRCLVWRPSKKVTAVHHCQVCQRCVVGFDHHCGVYGRCIVRRNMPCFCGIIMLGFLAMVTLVVAVGTNAPQKV
eukprot:TRINITY_DN29507_c0_g1_i2.p1 TRINITY_DN29507_c0_g1~~TRINITY_DN29507_c0_g1_i2.p1  ORF type:complete len:227 (-),score=26.85 TRINITY_DN29507_c0_g1_i2:119-799(-)